MLIPLVILLALAAFGAGILPWVVPVCCAVAALASLLLIRPSKVPMLRRLWWTGLFALLCLLLTWVPLPGFLVGARRDAHFERVEQALLDYQQLALRSGDTTVPAEMAEISVSRRLTLNRVGTIRFFFLFSGCWLMFWLVGRCSDRQRRWLLACLVLSGAGIAAAGLVGQWMVPQGKTLWWYFTVERGNPIGPFVNKNHFAAFCAMLTPAAVCLLVLPRSQHGRAKKGSSARRRWSTCLFYAAKLILLSAFALLVAATILSLSRGGLLALMAGLVMVVLVSLREHPIVSTATALAAVATIFALVFWPSTAVQEQVGTLREASETDSGQSRLRTWRDSVRLWRHYGLVGVGHEGFRVVFPLHKTHRSRKTFTHAENDYVQLLVDGGLIGVALFLVLLWGYVDSTVLWRKSFYGLRSDPHDRSRYASLAVPSSLLRTSAFGAVVVVACHSLLDFSLRIPLNAFLFAALLALALPLNRGKEQTPPAATKQKGKTRFRGGLLLTTHACAYLALLAAILYYGLSLREKNWWFYDRDTFLVQASTPELCRALTWAPTYWFGWYEMGRRSSARAAEYWHAGQSLPASDAMELTHAANANLTAPGTDITEAGTVQNEEAEGHMNVPADAPAKGPGPSAGVSKTELLRLSAAWQEFALACLKRSAECNQSNHEAWWQLGHAQLGAGNVEEARESFRHVVRLRPYLRPKIEELLGPEKPAVQ